MTRGREMERSATDAARERALLRRISKLNREHDLIAAGDRVMVACSGGKDSWALLHLLRAYQKVVPFDFEVVAMNLDQGHPGFEAQRLERHFEAHGFAYRMVHQDTYRVVREKIPEGKTQCPLCSRLRRGVLYRVASELGATKIALGHHREDALETLMLNLRFAGQLKAMPPRLTSDSGEHVVVRPLLACAEDDLAAHCATVGAPILPCDLCGAQPNLERQNIKAMLTQWERDHPGTKAQMLAALGNVVPSHLHDKGVVRRADRRPSLRVLTE